MPITPAPTLIELYNFQEKFEAAATAIISGAGIATISATSEGAVPLAYASVQFTPGPALDMRRVSPHGVLHYFRYTGGQLVVRLRWPRDDNGNEPGDEILTAMARTAAHIRTLFIEGLEPLNPENLNYYACTRLTPSGESRTVDADYQCDVTDLRWTVDFEILPAAFPTAS